MYKELSCKKREQKGESQVDNRYILDQEKYAAIARRASAEGCVLLRNKDQALPLKEGERVAVFGRIQFDYYKSGTGSGGLVNTRYVVGILDALKEENLSLDQKVEETYRIWLEKHPFDFGTGWGQEPWSQEEMPLADKLVKEAAARCDAAVVIIGRTAGEDQDACAGKGSYLLTDLEEEMLKKVSGAFSRTVVVLNVGSIIDMKWVEKYDPAAVLYVWQGGMEGGHGAADVLMGRVTPCGKLTDTIACDIRDYPSTKNFGGDAGDVYQEDIYVGYRYFETFARKKVLYPFGFGMSYTRFELSEGCIERVSTGLQHEVSQTVTAGLDDSSRFYVRFSVKVRNIGGVRGKEVAQVYVKSPQGKLGKPVRSLAAFAKTRELDPGEEQKLVMTISDLMLSSYDDGGVTGYKSCYVMEEGPYQFYIGTDVRNTEYIGTLQIDQTTVTGRCRETAAPIESFQRMRPAVGTGLTGDEAELSWESAPARTESVGRHMRDDVIENIPYTGDRGIRLGDVFDGRSDMRTFLAQMSDDDLCCIVKGEGMCSPKVTPGTAAAFGGLTESLRKLGIPCGCCADGPSGIRMDCGTQAFSLPNGVCLASSFNEELMEDLYEMTGAELRKNRIDTLLGPGINIHRNPLNGRNFEYFSEDPLVTGKIAAAQLRGMSKYGVTGTIKHFAGNNQEHNRRKCNSIVSERALREIYLRGFEIAVKEGGAHSIMTTYGAINGLWTAGNYDLLTRLLRQEWGYDGMVMTDWWAEMNDEGGQPSMDNLAGMVRAQNDVFMVVSDTEEKMGNLKESLASGALTRGMLLRCAGNILKMLMRSPVMERSLGRISDEEKAAAENASPEEQADFDLEYYKIDEYLELPGEKICTDRGESWTFGIIIRDPGVYRLTLTASAEGGELAQIPVSVFLNGALKGSITVNGTDGKVIEIDQSMGEIFFPNNYVRIYFAQSGMKIQNLKIWKEKGD